MRWRRPVARLGLAVFVLLAVACEGYTESGSRSRSQETMSGGELAVGIGRANGTVTRVIETGTSGLVLATEVELTVAKGSYRIELMGEDEQVTLTLEARDGQVVQGSGWMVTDAFGEARYRVTAAEAEEVEYSIVYTFQ